MTTQELPKLTTQELPKLTGTEKQTDWADKSRATALRGGVLEQELLWAASQHADASWWIENRNNARNTLLDSALKPDESGIKSGGNGTPANARSVFYDIVSGPKPADEKKERMQAKTALVNAAWGGLNPSLAADKLIQADYSQAVMLAAMESRLSYFADATDDFTPEKIASLQRDIQAWLDAKGGVA